MYYYQQFIDLFHSSLLFGGFS